LSSANELRHANLDGVHVGTGQLLLDPKNITIGDAVSVSSWVQAAVMGKGYAPEVADPAMDDLFGSSVALNETGDRLAVGARGDNGSGNVANASGAVRLFSFSDTNFGGATLQATLGKGYTGGKNVDVAALDMGDQFGSGAAL